MESSVPQEGKERDSDMHERDTSDYSTEDGSDTESSDSEDEPPKGVMNNRNGGLRGSRAGGAREEDKEDYMRSFDSLGAVVGELIFFGVL